MVVAMSAGSPGLCICDILATMASTTRSWIDSYKKTRETEPHDWPAQMKLRANERTSEGETDRTHFMPRTAASAT